MEISDFWTNKIRGEITKRTINILCISIGILLFFFGFLFEIVPITTFTENKPESMKIFKIYLYWNLFLFLTLAFIQNIFGRVILCKIKNSVFHNDITYLSETKSYLYFFIYEYKNINDQIQKIINNDNFSKTKNLETLKFLNLKNILMNLYLWFFLISFLVMQLSIKKSGWHWELMLAICTLCVYIVIIFPLVIIRQIIFNTWTKKYIYNMISEEQYFLKYKYLIAKRTKQKMLIVSKKDDF
ncbi:hypothetical protein [Williamsoniiplasma lucivorax]|uniref:Transmembrane protein n=1 Tax=Williamsoniiplasma lucivorax TaxID=209274 RepID=A0A2S5REG8_9MOLU|nr:hypothetical protein [Williamsoniiplasma lucivorax]PPE05716.1 hypothetical protein ELUCI_v1c00020 [Williamsoniiplasma lucivorax]